MKLLCHLGNKIILTNVFLKSWQKFSFINITLLSTPLPKVCSNCTRQRHLWSPIMFQTVFSIHIHFTASLGSFPPPISTLQSGILSLLHKGNENPVTNSFSKKSSPKLKPEFLLRKMFPLKWLFVL